VRTDSDGSGALISADLTGLARFGPNKMRKVGIFETPRSQTDLYCLLPGQAQRPQLRRDQDKIYLILVGRAEFHIGGERTTLGPGHALLARAGVEHGVSNPGPANLLLLVFIAPPTAP
jgi:mannose-6-phosphate isomerase-like protein (cupin superfamily)